MNRKHAVLGKYISVIRLSIDLKIEEVFISAIIYRLDASNSGIYDTSFPCDDGHTS
tara:strand:- start:325 stop:492 length:168 start_codon:yes stop_codon:yes gene_type:complete